MKNFKLMQVLPSLQSGGVEQGTIDVANHLAYKQISSSITSNKGQMISLLNKKYIQHNILNVDSKNIFKLPLIASKLDKLIAKQKINILHIRSRGPAWLLPFLDTKKIKTVSTFHNVYGNQNLFKNIYNKQLSKVDGIVAISNYVKNEIVKNYKINPNKIRVINRGIDEDFYNRKNIKDINLSSFLKVYNINTNKKIILYPGRITGWKGQIEFLDVVEFFKNEEVIFYFIGDKKNQSYTNKFLNLIKTRQLNNNCRVLGHFNKDDLRLMYSCADIVISAPLKPEGFGRIISESLSMEKIILAYNFGGAQDQLNLLDDLYKIKPYDLKEMSKKINIILNFKKDIFNDLRINSRKYVIDNFSVYNMQKSYLNFYLEL